MVKWKKATKKPVEVSARGPISEEETHNVYAGDLKADVGYFIVDDGNARYPLKLTSSTTHIKYLQMSILYTNWSSDENSSFTPQAVDSAKDFIRDSENPFFLTMNLLHPQLPYESPMENMQNIYDMDERPDICQNSKQFNSGARDIDESEWEDIRALYDGELNFLNQQLKSLYYWMEE